jgi:hypothetical protein
VLLLFGAGLVIMGSYFIFLRPPLLPEDLRYIGASQSQLESAGPRLAVWLGQVFRVMGGYVWATGILTMAVAATSFRSHHPGIAAAVAAAGAASIGWMTIVNFMINSDFKWVLFGTASLWAASMVLYCLEATRAPHACDEDNDVSRD